MTEMKHFNVYTREDGTLAVEYPCEQRWRDRAIMLAALARNLLHMHGDLLDRLVRSQGYDSATEARALEENFKCIEYWESMIRAFLGEDES